MSVGYRTLKSVYWKRHGQERLMNEGSDESSFGYQVGTEWAYGHGNSFEVLYSTEPSIKIVVRVVFDPNKVAKIFGGRIV